MIVVYSNAGLANRMFHYALYKAIEAKGIDVYFDEKSYLPEWNFEQTTLIDVFPRVRYRECQYFKRVAKKDVFSRIIRKLSWKYYINYSFKYDINLWDKLEGDKCLMGIWQSEKDFHDIKNDIREDFCFLQFEQERNREAECIMNSQNSVAIHIRKGVDYLRNPIFSGICPIEYYHEAIKYVREHVDNPIFYVFTDNKEWVLNNLTDLNYTLCDWNPTSGKMNYLDMQLMSCAKHNIISNSSYSWWAAWLNKNPDKIVVAPQKWSNRGGGSDIIPDSWIQL